MEKNDVLEEPLPTSSCSRGDGRSGVALAVAPVLVQQVAPVMVACAASKGLSPSTVCASERSYSERFNCLPNQPRVSTEQDVSRWQA